MTNIDLLEALKVAVNLGVFIWIVRIETKLARLNTLISIIMKRSETE